MKRLNLLINNYKTIDSIFIYRDISYEKSEASIKEFSSFLKTTTVYEHVKIYEHNIRKEVVIQTKVIIVKKMAKLNKLSIVI